MKNKLRIGIDIDDTICDFMGAYLNKFGNPKRDSDITKHVFRDLSKDKDFWMNLEIINYPDFYPELYCTKRVNSKHWTREFLNKHNLSVNLDFKTIPIYQQYYQKGNKSSLIKGKVDFFVDDSISNFIELNSNGVTCLLMNASYNQHWGPIGRVFSLNYDELEDTYQLFKHTFLENNFKQLI